MKTFFKVLKILIKVFTTATVLCWAWVGIGQLIRQVYEHPMDTPVESDTNVVLDTIENWKLLF